MVAMKVLPMVAEGLPVVAVGGLPVVAVEGLQEVLVVPASHLPEDNNAVGSKLPR